MSGSGKEAVMGRPTGAHVRGPLQPLARGFLSELVELGYSWTAQGSRLRLMAELSSWMAARALRPEDLTVWLLEEFLRHARMSRAGARWCSPSSQRQLLGYLRGLGLVPEPPAVALIDRIDRMLSEFGEYLVLERGLTMGSGTVRDYQRVARQFLSGHIDPGGGVEWLTAGEVTGFVLAQCRRLTGARSRKLVVTALRQLLRFLHLEGLVAGDLTGAVPLVAGWRGTSLPRGLDRQCVDRLLASCDRGRPAGRRDFVILLMLARFGLRCGEVAAMRLGDVDWRAGEIVIRGKADRHERLPLPVDVGEALVDYLRHGRPRRDDPHLLLQARAPFGPLHGGTVAAVVRYACHRAGIAPVGAHRLRHTVATEVLKAGAPLEEVASLLRHRRHATTVLYAKVDWQRLRELARPWPGSAA
jgi:site-specific recombinase XerD